MKRFLIMRHAKSSWGDPDLRDHDRPLNKRGRAAATDMGTWIADQGLVPNAALLSSAKRVAETWQRASAQWPAKPAAIGDRDLYMAWPARIIEMLRTVDEDAQTVMLVNHQPTVSALAHDLARKPVEAACARAFDHFPTAAVAVFEHDGAWAETDLHQMHFAHFQVPKEL